MDAPTKICQFRYSQQNIIRNHLCTNFVQNNAESMIVKLTFDYDFTKNNHIHYNSTKSDDFRDSLSRRTIFTAVKIVRLWKNAHRSPGWLCACTLSSCDRRKRLSYPLLRRCRSSSILVIYSVNPWSHRTLYCCNEYGYELTRQIYRVDRVSSWL